MKLPAPAGLESDMILRILLIPVAVCAVAGGARAQGADEILCRDPGVRDGAILACGGHEIRLWGIVAPRSGEPDFETSKAALEDLVRFRDVHCRVRRRLTPRADAATCYVGARDLSAAQVREGHATRAE
jgi:endonuclease YncB( thermonuclease family)